MGVSGRILSGFWVFLCTFYGGLHGFRTFFLLLLTFFDLLGAILTLYGPYRTFFGPKWEHFGVCLDHFWVDSGHLVIILASFWHHFGVVLGSFWLRFRPFWALFEPLLLVGPFLGHFSPCLCHGYGHSAFFLVMFRGVGCKIKQNDARKGKNMQISAKIHQKYAKLCKNKPLFRL